MALGGARHFIQSALETLCHGTGLCAKLFNVLRIGFVKLGHQRVQRHPRVINQLVTSNETIAALPVLQSDLLELDLVPLDFVRHIVEGFGSALQAGIFFVEFRHLLFVVLQFAVDLLSFVHFGRELVGDRSLPLDGVLDHEGLVLFRRGCRQALLLFVGRTEAFASQGSTLDPGRKKVQYRDHDHSCGKGK